MDIEETQCDFCGKRQPKGFPQSVQTYLSGDDTGMILLSFPMTNPVTKLVVREHYDLCDKKCLDGFLVKLKCAA